MKNKFFKHMTAFAVVIALALPLLSVFSMPEVRAAEGHENAVVMDVERFTIGQGFHREPVWVPFEEGDNAATLVKKIIGEENFIGEETYMSGIVGADLGVEALSVPEYITKMSGGSYTTEKVKNDWMGNDERELSEFVYGQQSGWCYTVNNEKVGYGIAAYKPKAGDVVRFQYTLYGYGQDLTGLKYDGSKVADISNKDVLVKAMADANAAFEAGESSEALRTAYDEAKVMIADAVKPQEEINQMAEKLNGLLEQAGQVSEINTMIGKLNTAMVADKATPGYDDAWYVMDLARGGAEVSQDYFKSYADAVYAELEKNDGKLPGSNNKRTEYSRTILALTAMGENAAEFGEKGYNLFEGLADAKKVNFQNNNGPIWALIALNSHPSYTIPEVENVSEQTTEQGLIDKILENQLADGGWTLFGSSMDSDLTGMAVYALAPYYNENPTVKAAVDKALEGLSKIQNEDGSFGSMGASTSESCSQLVVALSTMGIDADQDARFVKNGQSVLDALKTFYVEENGKAGFVHVKGSTRNNMATEQGYYALESYKRFKEGRNAIFDMSDVNLSDVMLGDVNGDGKVSARDALMVLKAVNGKLELNQQQILAADVVKDNKVTARDALFILKVVNGKVTL